MLTNALKFVGPQSLPPTHPPSLPPSPRASSALSFAFCVSVPVLMLSAAMIVVAVPAFPDSFPPHSPKGPNMFVHVSIRSWCTVRTVYLGTREPSLHRQPAAGAAG